MNHTNAVLLAVVVSEVVETKVVVVKVVAETDIEENRITTVAVEGITRAVNYL